MPSVVKTNAVELENLIALKDDATALANNQSVKNPCLQIFFTSQKSDGDPGYAVHREDEFTQPVDTCKFVPNTSPQVS